MSQPVTFNPSVDSMYDADGVGRCEAPDEAPEASASDLECEIKAAKAAVVCATGVAATLASAPTVVGAAAIGFLSGAACALEVADAYLCYEGE